MIRLSLSELVAGLKHARLAGDDLVIHGLTTDSRVSCDGALFVALRGERFDGHDYVRAALEQGAAAAMVERELDLDIPEDARLNWFVLYKFPEVLEEYQRLRNQGFNPAFNLKAFSNILSYGTAWGDGADNVVPKVREKRLTIDTYATVLLKPGDWPIQIVE